MSVRRWLAALLVSALVAGCSASRPPVCPPGTQSTQNAPGTARRVLVGIAEVIVGTRLSDPARDRVPCSETAQKDGGDHVPGVSDPPLSALVAQGREQDANVQAAQNRRVARAVSPGTTSEQRHQGRWIQIRKSARTLSVFDAERPIKTYPVVLGADPVGPKLYEGDRRTPEGEYHVAAKHVHPEWQRFMLLDYPTADNREVYAWSRSKGLIPARGGEVPGTGGAIGIHGTKDDDANRRGINWTWGCISLLSQDIKELYDIVPVGTLVVIEP